MSHELLQHREWNQAALDELNRAYAGRPTAELLTEVVASLSPDIAFANSFGLEDVALAHMLSELPDRPEVFVLDTGRLPQETYDLMERWRNRYDWPLKTMSPDFKQLEPFVTEYGPNAFYQSIELRKRCCHIRKIEPLERALAPHRAWLTGLRREQAATRTQLALFEQDSRGRLKINPLANWSLDDVWAFIKHHKIPYNTLHNQGYPSIGCAPCTRPIAPGEDIRAGRWWWEDPRTKECGLHSRQPRKEAEHATQSP
jgi:phosphoadenosine phosphosulfate reductase